MTNKTKFPTQFAPAERAEEEKLRGQSIKFSELTILNRFLNAIPDIFIVLNKERQIIYVNSTLLKFLGFNSEREVVGLRPGEALNCIHAFETEGGCGTTEFCRNCGAVKAILSSQKGIADVQECRIITRSGDALDLRVWATPFKLAGDEFTIFAVADISNEKRRRALERIFFHDILNTAGGIYGFAEILRGATVEEIEEFREIIYNLTGKLIEEIKAQRELTSAENNELSLNITEVKSLPLLFDLKDLFTHHDVSKEKTILINEDSVNLIFESDKVILRRVLGNMLKNALEASLSNQTVTLGCQRKDDCIEFWVNNQNEIPREVQLQIFQRSFTTKGSGRGLGTYSMKLLGEKYLKGKVYFESNSESGTTFFAKFNLKFPSNNEE
jgi:signal transduction histidine kinase